MSGGGLEIRGFRDGDERQLAALRATDGQCERALDVWAWRYPVFPAPRAVAVADLGGTVQAWCGGRRVRVWDGRGPRPAAVVQEVATLADVAGSSDLRRSVVARFVDDMMAEGRSVLAGEGVLGNLASSSFPIELVRLCREAARRPPPTRFLYRAELARDFEPRLDALWRRALPPRAAAIVRDAEHALRRCAGHPSHRFHRFVVLPRFGREAAAWVSFAITDGVCRWADLQWDRRHRGALALLAHLSSGVARQFGASAEEAVIGGDAETVRSLRALGFDRRGRWERTVGIAAPGSGPGVPGGWPGLAVNAADAELLVPEATR